MQQKTVESKKPASKSSAAPAKAKATIKTSLSVTPKGNASKPTTITKTKKNPNAASGKDLETSKSTSSVDKKAAGKKMDAKWGAQTIKAAGFTSVPNLLIDYQRTLKIDSVDLNILLILMKHWWSAGEYPYPSKETLSNLTGKDKSTVQKHLKSMEDAGLLTRDFQFDGKGAQINTLYDLTGLIEKLSLLAKDEIAKKAARKESDDRKKRGR